MTPALGLMVAQWDEELVGTAQVKTDDGGVVELNGGS